MVGENDWVTHAQRRDRTERRIIDAATELFLRNGYARTSLSAVADAATVAHRTVYTRFATKAALFQRVVEVAIVGDLDDTPLPHREWSRVAMSAPTLDARIDAFSDGVSIMVERLGPLMSVNGEVEPGEPTVQVSAGTARTDTLTFLGAFWGSAEASGLLPEGCDVEWLVATSTVLSAAETRLLISRTLSWDRNTYREWLATTWRRLVGASVDTSPAP